MAGPVITEAVMIREGKGSEESAPGAEPPAPLGEQLASCCGLLGSEAIGKGRQDVSE